MRKLAWGLLAAGGLWMAYLFWRERDHLLAAVQGDEDQLPEPPPRVLH